MCWNEDSKALKYIPPPLDYGNIIIPLIIQFNRSNVYGSGGDGVETPS